MMCVFTLVCVLCLCARRREGENETCGFLLGSFSSNLDPVTLSAASCKLGQKQCRIHKHTRTNTNTNTKTHTRTRTHNHTHKHTHKHTHTHTSNEAADNKFAYTIQTHRRAHPYTQQTNLAGNGLEVGPRRASRCDHTQLLRAHTQNGAGCKARERRDRGQHKHKCHVPSCIDVPGSEWTAVASSNRKN